MLLEIQERDGIVPKALESRPILNDRWVYSKSVFDELSGSRRFTMNGPANIPISEYDVYARGYGFSRLEWASVWEDVSIIDSIWLSEIAKKQAAAK